MKAPELILWEDHHEPDKDTWDSPTPADKLGPVIVHTVGFVVSENDMIIEVARDYYADDGEMLAGAFLQIMAKCIVSRKVLSVP